MLRRGRRRRPAGRAPSATQRPPNSRGGLPRPAHGAQPAESGIVRGALRPPNSRWKRSTNSIASSAKTTGSGASSHHSGKDEILDDERADAASCRAYRRSRTRRGPRQPRQSDRSATTIDQPGDARPARRRATTSTRTCCPRLRSQGAVRNVREIERVFGDFVDPRQMPKRERLRSTTSAVTTRPWRAAARPRRRGRAPNQSDAVEREQGARRSDIAGDAPPPRDQLPRAAAVNLRSVSGACLITAAQADLVGAWSGIFSPRRPRRRWPRCRHSAWRLPRPRRGATFSGSRSSIHSAGFC